MRYSGSAATSVAALALPTVLSLIAGSVDAIGFLGLDGLFTAHITGNLVILAARLVGGEQAPLAQVLSVPVFILVLGLVRLLAGGLERIGVSPLRPLLLLQFILLAGFLALCLEAGPHLDPNATVPIVAGMLGVSAMALQNALVQVALSGVPTTAVMTTNVTHFMMDLGAVALERDAAAARRAKHTLPAILGFAAGCGLGAWSEAVVGSRALVLPVALALLALAIGRPASPVPARRT